MRYLRTLTPGTRFRLAEMPEVTGTLVKVNECRAVVRLDRPEREVAFVDQSGETRQFKSRGTQVTSWAPTTAVEPVDVEPLNEESKMAKTAKTTKASKAAGTNSAAAKAKPAKAKADGKLSCIDAAAKVLAEAKVPMGTKEMIEQMAKKGYWTSPGGQTPAATLYSAILREIGTKGKDSRFKKTERGKFGLNG